jgi:hypothetical protein
VITLQTSARIADVLLPPLAALVSTRWPWWVVARPIAPLLPVNSVTVPD